MKQNFRPANLLLLLSKVISIYKLFCGFRKAHSIQHALFRLLQKWQKELHSSGIVGTILMDSSKACDCLPHDLIIELEAYGLYTNSLRFFLLLELQKTKN